MNADINQIATYKKSLSDQLPELNSYVEATSNALVLNQKIKAYPYHHSSYLLNYNGKTMPIPKEEEPILVKPPPYLSKIENLEKTDALKGILQKRANYLKQLAVFKNNEVYKNINKKDMLKRITSNPAIATQRLDVIKSNYQYNQYIMNEINTKASLPSMMIGKGRESGRNQYKWGNNKTQIPLLNKKNYQPNVNAISRKLT